MKTIFPMLFICLITTACGIIPQKRNSLSSAEVATQQAETIIECTVSQDSEKLKSILIPSLQASSELDAQIQQYFDFVDGNIISYSEPSGERSATDIESGKVISESLVGWIRNIKTDAGKSYEIRHYSINVSADNPDEIGVYYITIVDINSYNQDTGYPDDGRANIGEIGFVR